LKEDLRSLPDSFDDGKSSHANEEIESIQMNNSSFMSKADDNLMDEKFSCSKGLNMSTRTTINNCSLRQSRPVSMSAARLQPKSEINESSLDGEDSDGDKLIAEQPLLIDTTIQDQAPPAKAEETPVEKKNVRDSDPKDTSDLSKFKDHNGDWMYWLPARLTAD
jgi:hypothetical protein